MVEWGKDYYFSLQFYKGTALFSLVREGNSDMNYNTKEPWGVMVSEIDEYGMVEDKSWEQEETQLSLNWYTALVSQEKDSGELLVATDTIHECIH